METSACLNGAKEWCQYLLGIMMNSFVVQMKSFTCIKQLTVFQKPIACARIISALSYITYHVRLYVAVTDEGNCPVTEEDGQA